MDDAIRIGDAWRELRRGASMNALKDRLQERTGTFDLGQLDALDLLVRCDGVRMGDLADALRIEASTATRAVDRLVDLELAERSADPADGRRVVVRPTTAGRALHTEMAESRRRMLDRMLQGFSRGERRDLADLMERLVRALDEVVAEEDW